MNRMNKKSGNKTARILSLILCIAVLAGFLPHSYLTSFSSADSPKAALFFASDYQYSSSDSPAQPSVTLTGILQQVKLAGKKINTAVYCGDYTNNNNYNYNADATEAIEEIEGIFDAQLGTGTDTRFLQGNHDRWNASTMDATGAYEYEDYIVYIINTEGYNPWNQGVTSAKALVQAAANALDTYLQTLITAKDSRPVFIATHVPLHMSSRTSSRYSSGDNMYASYLFDVVNEAAKELDIVYLYGHNHSHGWDSYLGGSCVYRPVGSTIYIPDCNGVTTSYTNKFTEETLNFTYMNAGFTGYNSGTSADNTLTGSVFEIYSDHIEITRYSTEGIHNVGAVGSYNTMSDNANYNDTDGFYYNGTTYKYTPVAEAVSSPATLSLKNKSSSLPYLSIAGSVAAANVGNAGKLTASLRNASPISYEWSTTDASVASLSGSGQTISVSYNGAGTATVTCTVSYTDSEGAEQTVSDSYTVTVSAKTTQPETAATYEKVTSITSGDRYVIATAGGYALTNNNGSIGTTSGTVSGNTWTPPASLADSSTVLWTVSGSGTTYTVRSGYNNRYLQINRNSLSLGTSSANITFSGSGSYTLRSNTNNYYLCYNNGFTSTRRQSNATAVNLYKYTETPIPAQPAVTIVDALKNPLSGTYEADTVKVLYADVSNISKIISYNWTSSNPDVITLSSAISASPTARFTGTGTATISLTVTYEDGTRQTVSYTTEELTVVRTKKYERIYTLDSITSGENYLIIFPDSNNKAFLSPVTNVASGTAGLSPAATSITLSDTITGDYLAYEWIINKNNSGYTIAPEGNPGQYLNISTTSRNVTLTSSAANVTIKQESSGIFSLNNGDYVIDYSESRNLFCGYSYSASGNHDFYIYRLVSDNPSGDTTATAEIRLGTRNITEVLQRRYSVTSGQTEQLTEYIKNLTDTTVTWSSSAPGIATVDGSGNLTFTGNTGYTRITLTVTGTNSKGEVETKTVGVTYYATSAQKSDADDDYPDYPEEGALRTQKSATGVDFQTTGVTKIELDIDGVPATKLQDIVIVLDMSSSMKNMDRVGIMRESLKNLVTHLLEDYPDGSTSRNRVSIVAFNNYDYNRISSSNTAGNYQPDTESTSGYNAANAILTGGKTVADAFVDTNRLSSLLSGIDAQIISDNCASGTNYDMGLMLAYKILAQAKAEPEYDRKQTVVFMSDGAPFQYNYFRGYSGNGQTGKGVDWMAWIKADMQNSSLTSLLNSNSYAQNYLNAKGENHWAEAIKSTAESNKVIDPYEGDAASQYIRSVSGLGAEIYGIGFCLEEDGEITLEFTQEVLKTISSYTENKPLFFQEADNADSLDQAFNNIAAAIAYAATNAVVTDVVGAAFDIQYAPTVGSVDLTDEKYIGAAPTIEIGEWVLDDAGKRISYKAVEIVSFDTDADGNLTAAYSTLLSGNIYQNGIINAKNFTLDTNTEIYTWNIGTIYSKTQYTATYYAYLNGALEGTAEAGSYKTNEAAIADYTNYLGHECTQYFPVPVMPWQAINVTYEYYLVNELGQPINTNGAVVAFENRVIYGQTTQTITLNSSHEFDAYSLVATDVLPDGYELFNENTAYYIHAGSGTNESHAYISDDTSAQTTYVYLPSGVSYVPVSVTPDIGNITYNLEVSDISDYTNTHVAFAVVKTPEFTSRSVTKVWDDENNKNGVRPDSVTVSLLADGKTIDTVVLNSTNNWSYRWENLYKYVYKNGTVTDTEIQYTVVETAVPDYIPSYEYTGNTVTVTNTYTSGVAYILRVLKQNSDNEALGNAGFLLYTDEACQNVATVFLDPECTKLLSEASPEEIRTASDGILRFYGLESGKTYWLKEVYTPNGYTMLSYTLRVDISEDGNVTVTIPSGTYIPTVDNNEIQLTVTDRLLNVDIPMASGDGIFLYILIGLSLVSAAMVILLLSKRKMSLH